MPTVEEAEYLALSEEVGVVPVKYRNGAYAKLGIKPGEGGLGNSTNTNTSTGMTEFLAGIAAGADPKEFATQLLASTSKGRRAQKGA